MTALLLFTLGVSWVLPWTGAGAPTWREPRGRGHTRYRVLGDSASSVMRAESTGENSARLAPLGIDPRGVTLHWRWRVLVHPSGADPEVRRQDDRAAGVLVIVKRSLLPWQTRALLYQWTPARPRGEWSSSPYSASIRTLVLREAAADSIWRAEERDLGADLARAFGTAPHRIEAIGVIVDTDNTGGTAIAEFGPIELAGVAPRSGRRGNSAEP